MTIEGLSGEGALWRDIYDKKAAALEAALNSLGSLMAFEVGRCSTDMSVGKDEASRNLLIVYSHLVIGELLYRSRITVTMTSVDQPALLARDVAEKLALSYMGFIATGKQPPTISALPFRRVEG